MPFTWNDVQNSSAAFALFLIILGTRKKKKVSACMSNRLSGTFQTVRFQQTSSVYSPPTAYTCYARCSLRITHGPQYIGAGAIRNYNDNLASLVLESAAFSRRQHTLRAKRLSQKQVPVLGSDCPQTHTCRRVMFHLNINLPTENFHS